MAVSLYDFTVPVFTLALGNLSRQLDKAIAYAEQKKLDSKALTDARLIADMHPLTVQVQVACDSAKGAVARLAGIEPPKHEDNEQTLADLKKRIARTLDFIGGVGREQFAADETREILLPLTSVTFKFKALDYVTKFALPNFYFHATMAYALLRKNGIDVGKGDFLGPIQ